MTSNRRDPFDYPGKPRPIDREELLSLIQENDGPGGLDLRGRVFLADARTGDWDNSPMDLRRETLEQLKASHSPDASGTFRWLVSSGINLEGADLRDSWFPGTLMQGADLARAKLQKCVLLGTHLEGALLSYADLREARIGAFLQKAQLPFAKLQGACLDDVDLREANLGWAQLQRVDMYGVRSLHGAHWYGALLDHTRIRHESLGEAIGDELEAHRHRTAQEYDCAKEAYLLLKNNFNQIGRYEDASWAYVKEQQMEKMALYQEHRWWIWPLNRWMPKSWKSWWRWLLAWGTEALTKYGQDPWRPIAWAIALAVGLFPLLFWTAGNLHYQNGASITAYWDAISYSLTTFGTLSFNDLQPVGIATRVISAIEAFTGVLLFALLVFTLGNKMSRG
jgi:uncharacterized protein YjbI with pentapeptide repeats